MQQHTPGWGKCEEEQMFCLFSSHIGAFYQNQDCREAITQYATFYLLC